jgi:hypothetical protein
MKFGVMPSKEDTVSWQVQRVRYCGKPMEARIDVDIRDNPNNKEIINKNTVKS